MRPADDDAPFSESMLEWLEEGDRMGDHHSGVHPRPSERYSTTEAASNRRLKYFVGGALVLAGVFVLVVKLVGGHKPAGEEVAKAVTTTPALPAQAATAPAVPAPEGMPAAPAPEGQIGQEGTPAALVAEGTPAALAPEGAPAAPAPEGTPSAPAPAATPEPLAAAPAAPAPVAPAPAPAAATPVAPAPAPVVAAAPAPVAPAPAARPAATAPIAAPAALAAALTASAPRPVAARPAASPVAPPSDPLAAALSASAPRPTAVAAPLSKAVAIREPVAPSALAKVPPATSPVAKVAPSMAPAVVANAAPPLQPLTKASAKITAPGVMTSPAPAPAGVSPAYMAALTQCRAYMTAGKIRHAVDSCRIANTAAPHAPEALTLLAEAEFTRGHTGLALRLATEATNSAPGYADAYVIIGGVYQDKGKPAEARAAYEQYLALQPKGKHAADLRAILAGMP